MRAGVISKIIPFSCVDGPGNRYVIFLQGCNFNCKNCHNPQTIGHCNHCGECIEHCPAGALSLFQGRVLWDDSLCDSCDRCVDHCPESSSPITRIQTVAQVLEQLKTAAPFLDGVTVSGGEASVQLKFVRALFSEIKKDSDLKHLSCFIDSNGHLAQTAWETLLPVMDGAMIDLKSANSDLHYWLTGKKNDRVLESIRFLSQKDKLAELRFLAIPEITDTDVERDGIKSFIQSLGKPVNLRVNAFSNKSVKGEALTWKSLSEEGRLSCLDYIQLVPDQVD